MRFEKGVKILQGEGGGGGGVVEGGGGDGVVREGV